MLSCKHCVFFQSNTEQGRKSHLGFSRKPMKAAPFYQFKPPLPIYFPIIFTAVYHNIFITFPYRRPTFEICQKVTFLAIRKTLLDKQVTLDVQVSKAFLYFLSKRNYCPKPGSKCVHHRAQERIMTTSKRVCFIEKTQYFQTAVFNNGSDSEIWKLSTLGWIYPLVCLQKMIPLENSSTKRLDSSCLQVKRRKIVQAALVSLWAEW